MTMTTKPATTPNTNTQIVPANQKIQTIRTLLEKSKQQIALALPRHLSADRMLRVAMTSVQRTPELLACDQASLLGAIIQAAQLGLEPDGVLGHAYLVPYGKKATLIVGYRGLIDLARRSGQLSTIYARIVYDKDQFEYAYGLTERLEHIPSQDDPPGEMAFAYAVIRMKDGAQQFEVMSKREIEAIRKRSQAANNGPWVTDPAEMWKKTVLRRVCKMAPLSVEVARAVALDERADLGLPQQLEDIVEAQIEVAPKEGKPTLQTIVDAEKTDEVAQ
jgi:recombination protein RecT